LHALKKNPYAKTTSAIYDRGLLINTPRIRGQIMAECAPMRMNLLDPDLLAAGGHPRCSALLTPTAASIHHFAAKSPRQTVND
jgi:hypothetical protein